MAAKTTAALPSGPLSAPSQHITVLLAEAVDAIVQRPEGVYVDGTFGRGGHSRALLARLSPAGPMGAP